MSFERFCSAVTDFCAQRGLSVVFDPSAEEDGKHIAHTDNGVTFTGNSVSRVIYGGFRNHSWMKVMTI